MGAEIGGAKDETEPAGTHCDEEDLQPINIRGGSIEAVKEFAYLGSIVDSYGDILKDVENRIAHASRAFGALRRSVFMDSGLSLRTKRLVYRAVVLGVLLYGSETWATKRVASRKIEVFHNRCLRNILGITKMQQRLGRISSVQVAKWFGMEESLEEMIAARRLWWLGHVARMNDDCTPKRLLFGWLPNRRPAHGTKLRWRDRARKDLKNFNIEESSWYQVAQDRNRWRRKCKEGLFASTKRRVAMDREKQANTRQKESTRE